MRGGEMQSVGVDTVALCRKRKRALSKAKKAKEKNPLNTFTNTFTKEHKVQT